LLLASFYLPFWRVFFVVIVLLVFLYFAERLFLAGCEFQQKHKQNAGGNKMSKELFAFSPRLVCVFCFVLCPFFLPCALSAVPQTCQTLLLLLPLD